MRLAHITGDTGVSEQELLGLFRASFGGADTLWPANQRWLVRCGGQLIGHASVQRRWFVVHRVHFEGWFVGGVCTVPAMQRRGIGTALMRQVHVDLIRQELKFAVLNCGEPRVGFYERVGYRRISDRGLYLRRDRLEIDDDPALVIGLDPGFDINVLKCEAFPFGFEF